jgi:PAS domain S-box-containing protein
MVVRLARNLHVLGATRPLLQLLGRALPDLVARSFVELVHPEDAPALRASLTAALADGEGHDVRFRVFSPPEDGAGRSQGGERHLQMDVMVCPDENGAPSHLRCHLLDVTDRVRTERQLVRTTREAVEANARLRQANDDLQRLKESYRDLYHQAPVLYFSLDGRGRFVAINETMLRVLGYPREALLNQPYARLLPGGAEGKSPATGADLQRPGEVEARWVKQDGTVIDVWVGTTTLQDEQGNFLRSRSAALDVTEQRCLAGAVRGKAEELERANGQLRLINQELEEFTYVVSHDLKEPLRTLEAFSNFLAQDYASTLGAEGKDYINHLTQASRRLGALIDDLLTLSRAGRVLNTPRPFAYDEAVDVALSDLRDLIARKQATVRVEGPLPELSGDPERVIQLVTNLVANALKYNRSAVPEVVLGVLGPGRAHPEMNRAAPPFCTLFVRDNGVGIDPTYHEQVFRMFRRLHRRDEVEGTGAGLTICKKIVEAHGGRIWVESQVGRGATFFFTLPAAVGPQFPAPLSRVNGHGERAQADALVV